MTERLVRNRARARARTRVRDRVRAGVKVRVVMTERRDELRRHVRCLGGGLTPVHLVSHAAHVRGQPEREG